MLQSSLESVECKLEELNFLPATSQARKLDVAATSDFLEMLKSSLTNRVIIIWYFNIWEMICKDWVKSLDSRLDEPISRNNMYFV